MENQIEMKLAQTRVESGAVVQTVPAPKREREKIERGVLTREEVRQIIEDLLG